MAVRWAVGLTVVVVLVGAALVYQKKVHSEDSQSLGAPATTEPEQTANRRIFAGGIVEGTDRERHLRFEISGTLVAIDVNDGDAVKKDQVLARLDDSDLQAQLEEATASVKLAKAERVRIEAGEREETKKRYKQLRIAAEARSKNADQEYNREASLRGPARNVANLQRAEAEKDRYLAELNAARAQEDEIDAPARAEDLAIADAKIQLAETQTKVVQARLAKTVLKAPVDGVILRTQGSDGEFVSPEQAQPIITMVNVDKMHVRAFVEELDAFDVEIGDKADCEADGKPGERFSGTVVSAEPYMTPKRNYTNEPGERVDVKVREVRIELDDAQGLTVGLPVDVYFERTKSP